MKLILTEKTHLTSNIWSFRFRAETPFSYQAGQYIDVKLQHQNMDDGGDERTFTNSAAPFENVVRITTRVSDSSFKQALSKLNTGETIEMTNGPDGEFTWPENPTRPLVFIAGGIGVTPFHSILAERAHAHESLADVTLVYAVRSEDEVAFSGEIETWKTQLGLNVAYLVDQTIDAESLEKAAPELKKSLVYLSGPEAMVEDIGEKLTSAGLDAAQLVQDYFPGYDESNY